MAGEALQQRVDRFGLVAAGTRFLTGMCATGGVLVALLGTCFLGSIRFRSSVGVSLSFLAFWLVLALAAS